MASQQQIDANSQNTQNSTGLITPRGKAASQNVLTYGFTARDVCINGEDPDEFDATRQSFEDKLHPVGPIETLFVQQIVLAAWRLARMHRIARTLEKDQPNLSLRNRLDFLRYEAHIEGSFYGALRELRRLQAGPKSKMAKQSQIAPRPMPQKDLTPPSSPSLAPSRPCGGPIGITSASRTSQVVYHFPAKKPYPI